MPDQPDSQGGQEQGGGRWARARDALVRSYESPDGAINRLMIMGSDALRNASDRLGSMALGASAIDDTSDLEVVSDSFNFSYDKRLVAEIQERTVELGYTKEEFIVRAIEFEIMRRMVQGDAESRLTAEDSLMLIAVRDHELGEKDAMSFADILRKYGAGYKGMRDTEDVEKIAIEFDEEQVASMMLAIGVEDEDDELDVYHGDVSREDQLRIIRAFTGTALRHFLTRLDAEADGWRFKIDGNRGEDNVIEIDSVWNERGDDAAS